MDDPTITVQTITQLLKQLNDVCFDAVWVNEESTEDQKTEEDHGGSPFCLVTYANAGGDLEYVIKFLDFVIWQSACDERDLIAYKTHEEYEPLDLFIIGRARKLASLINTYKLGLILAEQNRVKDLCAEGLKKCNT